MLRLRYNVFQAREEGRDSSSVVTAGAEKIINFFNFFLFEYKLQTN
jgi:hypothetical protein